MASIRARGKKWEVRVSTGQKDEGGRYVYESHLAATREQAEALAAHLEAAKPQPSNVVSVGSYLHEWLSWKEPHLSPSALTQYQRAVTKHLAPLHHLPLADLTTQRVDGLYGTLVADGLSSYVIKQVHVALSSALSQAVKWGKVDSNAAHLASPPAIPKKEVQPPSVEEVQSLIALADDDFKLFLLLAATTGCRRGELGALTWTDVDWTAGTISVTKSLDTDGHLRGTKTGASKLIPLDGATLAMLKDAYSGEDDGRLFPSITTGHSFSDKFRKLSRSAGVTCRLHDLRHFTATQLLAAGVDVITVAKRLGHSSPVTTLAIYGHATTKAEQEAACVMGNLLS